MSRLRPLLFTLAIGLACASPVMAQWKWKDKDGRTQYSDVPPPPEVKDSDILQRPAAARRAAAVTPPAETASAAAPAAAASAKVDTELEARRKKTEEAAAAKKKEELEKQAAARKENCTQARNYAKTLEDGVRVTRTTANGEREILDDTGRAEEMKRARATIASDCK